MESGTAGPGRHVGDPAASLRADSWYTWRIQELGSLAGLEHWVPGVQQSLHAWKSGTLAGRTRNIPGLAAPGEKQHLPYGSPSSNLGGHKRSNHGDEVAAC